MALMRFLCVLVATAGICAAQTKTVTQGLTVTLETRRAAIKPAEPLVLSVTFSNTSNAAFRVPNEITPALANLLYVRLQDTKTGAKYTGVTTLPGGAAAEPENIRPVVLEPGDRRTVVVVLSNFVFVEGAMGYQAARNVFFPERLNPGKFPLREGTYDISLGIRFTYFLDRPNLPEHIVRAKALLDSDPVPMWKADEVVSNTVRIDVRNDAVVKDSETTQIGKDHAASVLQVVRKMKQETSFVSPRVHAGLWDDLNIVESIAAGIQADSGQNAAAFMAAIRNLNDAVNRAMARAREISRRDEPLETQTRARSVAASLSDWFLRI